MNIQAPQTLILIKFVIMSKFWEITGIHTHTHKAEKKSEKEKFKAISILFSYNLTKF